MQNPFAMLSAAVERSVELSDLIRDRLRATPSTPSACWNLIIHQDGVSPSDGLGKNQSKKSVFYWSILEFGMDALAHEELWFCHTI